jgi:DNA-binding protein Fis
MSQKRDRVLAPPEAPGDGRGEASGRAAAELIRSFSGSLTLPDLLEHAVSIVQRATGAAGAFVHLWDPEEEALVLRAATDGDQKAYVNLLHLGLGEGITGWCALTRRAVVLDEQPSNDPRFKYFPELREEDFRAGLAVPILASPDEMIGVLSLWSERARHFKPAHLSLAEETAVFLASITERLRVMDEAARRDRVLAVLVGLCERLPGSRPLEQTLDSIASSVLMLMESELCLIVLLDQADQSLVLKGIAPSRTDYLAWAQGAVARGDLTPSEVEPRRNGIGGDTEAARTVELADFHEAISAPMVIASDHLGFVNCYRHRPYGEEDRRVIQLISTLVVLGLKAAGRGPVSRQGAASQLLSMLQRGEPVEQVTSIAAAVGWKPTTPSVVLLIRVGVEAAGDEEAVADRVRAANTALGRLVLSISPTAVLEDDAGTMRGLLTANDDEAVHAIMDQLEEGCTRIGKRWHLDVQAGLSGVCRAPGEYPEGFCEAEEALTFVRLSPSSAHVRRFEQLVPEVYLLRMSDSIRSWRSQQVRQLWSLAVYDRERGTQLLETLDRYLACRRNVSQAAKELFIHRNTLRQRLARIESLTGLSLETLDDWFALHFAVRIVRAQIAIS